MTLPVGGTLSAQEVNVEVGRPGVTLGNAGEPVYRALAEVADSGSYSAVAFYGKNVIKELKAALSTYLHEMTFIVGIGRSRFWLEVTCTPSGGVPPYAYAWEMLSEIRGHPYFYGDKTEKLTFSSDPVGDGSTWRCRVTDSRGVVTYSPVLQLIFKYKQYNPGKFG